MNVKLSDTSIAADTSFEAAVDDIVDAYDGKIAKGYDAEFLRILCSSLDVGVSILDENLNYVFISDAVFRDLNVCTTQLHIGDPLSRCHELMLENGMLTPELIQKNNLSDQKLKDSSAQDAQRPSVIKLGNDKTFRFIRKPISNGYTVSMARDITELVEKDRILEESLTLGYAGYWTYDLSTKDYYLSNSMSAQVSDNVRQEIDRLGLMGLFHPQDRDVFKQALKTALKTNNKFDIVSRYTLKHGKIGWAQVTGQIILNQYGKPKQVRAFVKDVTRERRQAKELEKATDEAVAASQAKSEFLANMSHEIRTPMNGILGMAELLASSNIDDRQREFVNVINNSASALLTIINDILDFSKIEAGALEMDPMPFNLKEAVNDVASMLTSNAHEKGLEIIVNYPSKLKSNFIGDGGRLRQVITNLLGNAIKFTESGHIIADIDVNEFRNKAALVTVSITDTGIGIEPEKLNKVFHKFTQADSSTTRVYGGTGLGLSISRAIVEMMGGRVSAESTFGEGSTFTARIPLEIDTEANSTVYDATTLSGKHALIVDDIKANRSVLTEQLASWDIKSNTVKDGVEALTHLKDMASKGQYYDLIVLDFLMPGMNGRELAEVIASTSDLPETPIIMLSSSDQPVSSKQLKSIGITKYLIKPAREARLHDAIVQALSSAEQPSNANNIGEREGLKTSLNQSAAKIEILVAEDFALNQDVVRLMLADTNFSPVFADNGQEAVDIYKADPNRFPVIIMDVSMPVMDGHQATKTIQAYEEQQNLKAIPIIALTGHALKNDRNECLEAGMCDYLTKPVKQSDLLEKIIYWTGTENKTSDQALSA